MASSRPRGERQSPASTTRRPRAAQRRRQLVGGHAAQRQHQRVGGDPALELGGEDVAQPHRPAAGAVQRPGGAEPHARAVRGARGSCCVVLVQRLARTTTAADASVTSHSASASSSAQSSPRRRRPSRPPRTRPCGRAPASDRPTPARPRRRPAPGRRVRTGAGGHHDQVGPSAATASASAATPSRSSTPGSSRVVSRQRPPSSRCDGARPASQLAADAAVRSSSATACPRAARLGGGGETGRPGADDDDAPRRGAPAAGAERPLAPGARVLRRSGSASRRGSGAMQRVAADAARASRPRPGRAPCAGSSGSVISARFMPNASARPSPIRRSASSGSTTRVVAISGGPTRKGAVSVGDRVRGRGGGGTMPTQPSKVAESPIATCT